MKLETRPITAAVGTILVHNIAFPSGRIAVRKGTTLTAAHLETLQEMSRTEVLVAVLDENDVAEDEAAQMLAEALQTESLRLSRAASGRINLRAEVDGLLVVDADRLLQLNLIPGMTLATLPQQALVGPRQELNEAATLKIIPYAVAQVDLAAALALARPRPGIIDLRPIRPGQRVALLLTGELSVHQKLIRDFEPPTRARLKRLSATLNTVKAVPQTIQAISEAAAAMTESHDLLIIAGQTSIMDSDDTTLAALKEAGADVAVHGAPVEPGNLLALAYFPDTPVMCAPGCARDLNHNVVDLILPRLLLGDRLGRIEIAQLGLGGLLT